MKIAWYTPFSAHSAIGHFSKMVVAALRNLDLEVQIVRSELRTPDIRSTESQADAEKLRWASDFDRSVKAQLAPYDLVVYNVGDHYDYHAYCYRHQSQAPGLTILHDYSLHSAMNHHCHLESDNGTYRDNLGAEWGEPALAAYDRALASGDHNDWWQNGISQFPTYRWALRETLAVVTHATFYRDAVANRLGCPVTTIPLAYDSPCQGDISSNRDPNDKLTLLTVGAVNANKRYEATIQAIAESELLRNRIRYRIVGAINDSGKHRIEAALKAQSHEVDVTLTGNVDRDTLERELVNADAMVCLRYPALEGASASVVEALLTGKPVIVCRTGCYAEIPEDLAFHVAPDDEVNQLSAVLHNLVNDYDTAQERGRRACKWARARHAADAYVDQLLRFIPNVLYDQPVLAVADRIGKQLRAWRVPENDVLMGRVDLAMDDLFGIQPDETRAA